MIDANLMFDGTISAAGAVTGAAITASRVSTNVLDMLAARDVGAGNALQCNVQITQAFATLTSLQVKYQTSADNSTFVDVLLSPVVLTASLVVGAKIAKWVVPVFQLNDVGTPNRYHRLSYVVAGSDATTGAVIAYISAAPDQEQQIAYPRGYSIGA